MKILKYIFSRDHKIIAKQFLITAMFMGFIGLFISVLFRLQLAYPNRPFYIFKLFFNKFANDGYLDPSFYLSLVTIHGTIMIFFVLTGGLSGTFSNLLIPLQIGARDMASPFLNMLSYWLFLLSSLTMLYSFFVITGPASAGWTIYPPLSALPKAINGSGTGQTVWLISMSIFIISSLIGNINYITTIMNMRTQGLTMYRLPIIIWALLLTAILGLLSFPVLMAAVILLILDRGFGTSFYLSDIFLAGEYLHYDGGSPILFQHLFWFLGHPEVYIVILPALGISSEILSINCRKPLFGYHTMIYSLIAIAGLSFFVWAHHMFISGINPLIGSVFTITTLIIAVPSAIKVFNYIATIWRGNIKFTTPMLFTIGLISFFITGGLTGIYLGNAILDINLNDTYFVVAHFHIVMGSAAIFGMFAGIYHWYPKLFQKMMNEKLGHIHFWITYISIYLIFFPMHFMGINGMPRRYYDFNAFGMFNIFINMNKFITIISIISGFAQLIFLYNFTYSMFKGKDSSKNPWKANTLEWTTPIEHIHGNWENDLPVVYRWPYEYSNPKYQDDYMPQNISDKH
ncbi:MAG: cbb3-type cytochrome c oxidase subunit I [Bacteroides sp.]|nr:MAG: cbb3-type cytochrome c oxidase subunit I [Bacteroides sp.]